MIIIAIANLRISPVNGNGMLPMLENGQKIMYYDGYFDFMYLPAKKGDIVIIDAIESSTFEIGDGDPISKETDKLVKVVIGVAGDTISSEDGQLLVNGVPARYFVESDFIPKKNYT